MPKSLFGPPLAPSVPAGWGEKVRRFELQLANKGSWNRIALLQKVGINLLDWLWILSSFSSVQSALSHRHCSLGKYFHSSGDWGCFPAFAFCILHTKHLAVRITSCFSSPGPCLSFPAGPESLAGMVKSNRGGEGRKVMAILTTGWPMPDSKPAGLWQEDRRGCLVASFSPLLIGLYEYLMKSRWNSIRSFTCCIFRRKKKKKWQDIIRFL